MIENNVMDNTKSIELNFTGKKQLSSEEFIKYYDKLWKLAPHSFNWPSDEEIKELKCKREKIYNSDKEVLDGESWRELPGIKSYKISTFGRVKINKKLLKQADAVGKTGYLVLVKPDEKTKVNTSTFVYTLVAKAFLGKTDGDGLHVHHIDNNGYDCSVKNLILLTAEQHKIVHLDRFLTPSQIKDALNPKKRYSEDTLKLHLSNYKIEKLTTDCGVWKRNGKKYAHILPDCRQNLIDVSYKKDFDKLYEKQHKNLHIYFSHLTSSQALCFNLFYPICITKKFELIDERCDKNTTFHFEYTEKDSFEKQKDKKDKTNFDFFLQCNDNKFYFEVKYTEQVFGHVAKVEDGDQHDKKYNDYYKAQLKDIAPKITKKEFFNNYQLWRNICHVIYGTVFFVCLKDRIDLISDVEDAIKQCNKKYQNKIKILKIEDIVKKVLQSQSDEAIKRHYIEFSKKYLEY